jgi:hypothetical protein
LQLKEIEMKDSRLTKNSGKETHSISHVFPLFSSSLANLDKKSAVRERTATTHLYPKGKQAVTS